MLFLSTDGRFSHLSEYNCEDLMAVVYYFLFCQMSVYFKGMRGVMKGTWWRATKSEQNQEEPWKILWLLDLQVRVHDIHDHIPHSNLGDLRYNWPYAVMSGLYLANSGAVVKLRSGYFHAIFFYFLIGLKIESQSASRSVSYVPNHAPSVIY